MQQKKQLDKITIIYLMDQITRHHGIKNVPVVKLGRLMYLLWLEYASLQPGLSFPVNSPMASMRFINYERGPAEMFSSENYNEYRSEIMSGNIPKFSQTTFNANEKHNLIHALETVRNCYSVHRATDLCNFIMYDLPTCSLKPRIAELVLTEQEFAKELKAFMCRRKKLK